mgnify:CR=1 FL=1
MAKQLERLVVRIEGDTRTLRRELRVAERSAVQTGSKMERAFDRAGAGVKRLTRNLSAARVGLGLVAGAVALGALTKAALNAADEIGKTADRIGLTTDALQEFRIAGEIAGVEVSKLDKGFEKFSRNMGDLERTSSEAETALKDLDPALLKNLKSFSNVEDQLNATLKALGGYESQQKRAAVAASLFGRSGIAMTNIVRDGIESLEKMRQTARDLGLILDESLIRGAEEANDKLLLMTQTIKIKAQSALLELAPVIIAIADAFFTAALATADFFGQMQDVGERSTPVLTRRLKELETQIDSLNTKADKNSGLKIGLDRDRQRAILDNLKTEIAQLTSERAAIQTEIERRASVKRPPAAPKAEEVAGDPKTVDKDFDRLMKKFERQREQATRFLTQIRRERLRAAGQEIALIRGVQAARLAALEKMTLDEKEKADARVEINAAAEDKIIKVIKKRAEAAQKASEKMAKDQEKAATSMTGSIDGLGRNFSRTMAEMLVTGESTFENLAQSFLVSFVDAILQDQIVGPLVAVGKLFLKDLFKNQHGNVYAGGRVVPFARGGLPAVGNSPAAFAISGGIGTIREGRRYESIMPLARIGGDLGIRAEVVAPIVTVTVINNSQAQAQVRQSRGPGSGRSIEVIIDEAMARNIRQGGETFRAIDETFQTSVQRTGR